MEIVFTDRAIRYSVPNRIGPAHFGPIFGPGLFVSRSSVRSRAGPVDRKWVVLFFYFGRAPGGTVVPNDKGRPCQFSAQVKQIRFFFSLILSSISHCLLFTCSSLSSSSPSPCPSLSLCLATSATCAYCLASPESPLGASSSFSISLTLWTPTLLTARLRVPSLSWLLSALHTPSPPDLSLC